MNNRGNFVGITKEQAHSLKSGDLMEALCEDKRYILSEKKNYRLVKVLKVYEHFVLCAIMYRNAWGEGYTQQCYHYTDLRFPGAVQRCIDKTEEELMDRILAEYADVI